MHHVRWHQLMRDDNLKLTENELHQGWHFCNEFDGLLVKSDPAFSECGDDCVRGERETELEGCSTPGCGYPDGKPCIRCGVVVEAIKETNKMSEYKDLGPDDVLMPGDQWNYRARSLEPWFECDKNDFGRKVKAYDASIFQFRRPITETKAMLRISVEDGKYTLVQDHTGKQFALRYGKPWRDLIGDKLTLAMGYEIESLREQLSRLQRENDTLRAEKEKVELGLNHAKDQRDTWRKRFLATAHRATTAESRVAELEKVLQIAPEPYEFMSKSDFNSLPTTMRSFVDAHKTWLTKAKSTLTALNNQPGVEKE